MELNTARLYLREVLQNDVEDIHDLHSLPETDQFNTIGIPETIETSRQLIATWLLSQDEVPRIKYVFRIENRERKFVGLIGLNFGKPKYRNAEIWFKLHPAYWNQGLATEAVNAILHWGFSDLKLHRIEAGCAVENIASKRVLEKAGMTQEGLCRKILPIRGQWMDNFEFAILDTDYNSEKLT